MTGISNWAYSQNVADYKKYHNQGRELAQKEQFKEAITAYDQAIQTMPYYSQLYHDRADAKLKLRDYDGAIADYTIAIQKKPHDIYSYQSRGVALYHLEEYAQALTDFEKVLEFSPYHAEAQKYQSLAQNAHNQVLATSKPKSSNQQQALIQNQRELLRRQRRANRNQIIWGNIVPTVIWTTAFLIW